MQSSFLHVFKCNLSGQLISKICSFIINLYLIRNVDPSLMGFLFVRMTLLYNTIGFLTREPLRKTCLSPNLSIKESLHYALISTPLCFLLCIIISSLWFYLPLPDYDLQGRYSLVLSSFAFSAFIEGVAEPVAILSLKLGENTHFAFAHATLTLLQKLIVLVLLMLKVDCLTSFCVSQVVSSSCYTAIHFRRFIKHYSVVLARSFTGSWVSDLLSFRFDQKNLLLIGTLIFHSLLKQFITDGSAYVMAFTNILPLNIQAVYDAVERLASLVARIILTPMEESAAIYFSSNIRTSNVTKDIPKKVLSTFVALLRLIVILGIVVCVFSVPYSKVVIQIYGGSFLTTNGGAKLLSLYTIYLLFMAINGIIECFAFASMDTPKIFSHGAFLFFSSVVHLILNLVLSNFLGASGFILANSVNTILRIVYNWRHIKSIGTSIEKLSVNSILPSFTLCVLLVVIFCCTTLSFFLFGNTGGFLYTGAHLAVGGVTFLGVLAYLYQSEDIFTTFLEKSD